jgi:hypothetical protein
MALLKAYIYPAASPITPATPSATVGDHDSDGTDITITAIAHGLQVGELVTLTGWVWTGGVIDGTYYVKTVGSADLFSVTPSTCPANLSNPTTVGTYKLASHDFNGMRIGVVASSGYLVVLPTGWWSIRNTGKSTDGSDNTSALAYRFADSVTDTTLPTATYVVNTRAAQRSILIEPGADEVIEIRGKPAALLLESASGTLIAMIRPSQRGLVG